MYGFIVNFDRLEFFVLLNFCLNSTSSFFPKLKAIFHPMKPPVENPTNVIHSATVVGKMIFIDDLFGEFSVLKQTSIVLILFANMYVYQEK